MPEIYVIYAVVLHNIGFLALSALTAKYLFDRYVLNGTNRVIKIWTCIFGIISIYAGWLIWRGEHFVIRGETLLLSYGLLYSLIILKYGKWIWKRFDLIGLGIITTGIWMAKYYVMIPTVWLGWVGLVIGIITAGILLYKPILKIITPLSIDIYIILMLLAQFAALAGQQDIAGIYNMPLMLSSSILTSIAAVCGFWSARKEARDMTLRRGGGTAYLEKKITNEPSMTVEKRNEMLRQLDDLINRIRGG